MKLGANQPYFLPYIGFFQLIGAVDKYIICDDFNYIKSGWINRNKLLLGGKEFVFHLATLGASQNKRINEIAVDDNQHKLAKTIEVNYRKAPLFDNVFPLIQDILNYEDKNLARYVGNSMIKIAEYLQLPATFFYSSEIPKDHSLRFQERVINICNVMGATTYINAIGGMELYNKTQFSNKGVDLFFLKSKPITYKQFGQSFVPNLSMLDILMFNTVEQTKQLLLQYEFIQN
ncbi:MAG: WbqC family protein [Bacteroidales bacterium]|jgi:hypothetical protein|nr:WbqC family protein [Bacteroidales bacterium]